MKISLSWLQNYIDIKKYMDKPDVVANKLVAAGLEVEAIENLGKDFDYLVVGQIMKMGKHPNADRLTLCQVDTGAGTKQIVCGAKNHKQGDKVVVAQPGAVLPGDFKIKLSKIRDVESHGMLCSEKELGLSEEADGILILPSDATVGRSFAEHYGLNDITLDIAVTPNRADCLSHIGLARELGAILDKKVKYPSAKFSMGKEKTKDQIKVQLKDKELCTRYCGRSIFGVKIGPSPAWLRQSLHAVGMNSINNVVDVTNFVMMEYGQPLHAFDASQIKGQKIIIEKSKKGEKFQSFDESVHTLDGTELTIRDQEKAVALAGVVGGTNSGVTDDTTEIFLEAAHFNPEGVRKTARKHGIDTDSSYRFSRGTDPDQVVSAMNRAVALIIETSGGHSAKDYIDEYPKPAKKITIQVRKNYLEDRLGYPVKMTEFKDWMLRLQCKVSAAGAGKKKAKKSSAKTSKSEAVKVTPPSFRVDLEQEVDLVEEFARLHGYDHIPETFPPLMENPSRHVNIFDLENRVSDLCAREGFCEARNYSFVNSDWQDQIVDQLPWEDAGLTLMGDMVPVKNPLSEETGVMRRSLLPGLLTNLIRNVHYGQDFGRLFELGSVFGRTEKFGIKESTRLAFLDWGLKNNLWNESKEPVVFRLKSSIEAIVRRLSGKCEWRDLKNDKIPSVFHPGQCAGLFYQGNVIGFVGTLHPSLKDEHKIRTDVALAEVDFSSLTRGQPRTPKVKKLSKFPAVERDLAFVMPLELPAGNVIREIAKAGAPLIGDIEVFDVFKGGNLPEGTQSVAFRFRLQDQNSTLSEGQLKETSDKIIGALEKKFGIKTR